MFILPQADEHWLSPDALPLAVKNLLALHSMEAVWSESDNGIPGWRLRLTGARYINMSGWFLREGAPLDEWIALVAYVERWFQVLGRWG